MAIKHNFEETPLVNSANLPVNICTICALRTCYPEKEQDCEVNSRSDRLNRIYKEGIKGKWGRYYNLIKQKDDTN